ncbi:hypothetical protein WICANDRAFT_32533 [Wickerhamomyces anomalus NRRL Y-366-8]|uniref:Large ribosomal subunit protein mL53 n=1 Tax=Wickerhamomyces anomalus (strain ATCC 58044 / CBS 1984 / NCYC 433 / NRRL Y-366-8) TaxID=683960 RepID=A0A1E3P1A4_WICAA|nr:uncharacterized protein WICANDRAFT_32533 [Wickerhamomyces anomalus NRRL Y-366-8]ODQ59231.1 hypothetical protein WICANDRAFT_32533 [Wickerhamomyces anomalus NRRL Y-366-8]
MITKYFTKVVVKFNPLDKGGKNGRLFLSQIPPALKGACSIDHELLNATSKNAPIIKVTFKDKKSLETDPTKGSINEIASFFDRHSRQLQFKESIEK